MLRSQPLLRIVLLYNQSCSNQKQSRKKSELGWQLPANDDHNEDSWSYTYLNGLTRIMLFIATGSFNPQLDCSRMPTEEQK